MPQVDGTVLGRGRLSAVAIPPRFHRTGRDSRFILGGREQTPRGIFPGAASPPPEATRRRGIAGGLRRTDGETPERERDLGGGSAGGARLNGPGGVGPR